MKINWGNNHPIWLRRWLAASLTLLALVAGAAGQPESAKQLVQHNDAVTGMAFVPVPAGCFSMGSAAGSGDEKPVHEVCVSAFYLGKFEVTQGQWRVVMGENPSRFAACGDACPVEQVSSAAALEFIRRLNHRSGTNYRLPTEAEWEYACTSGGKKELYCGANNPDSVAWYEKNSGGQTHPVGQKQANGLGLHDMSGNVWEWVADWKERYPVTRQQDPTGVSASSTRVRRGGSWQYGTVQQRATWRSSGYPDDYALDLGFRLAAPAR